MADPRAIHEFTTGEVEATTLLLGDFVDLDAQSGYTTLKMSVSDLGEVLLEDIEYTQDLQTTDKTIVGAINENKSVIGYSYDEYDPTTAYSTGDLCIYNNTLYKALQATTGNLPTNTTYWEQTSIADAINEVNSNSEYHVGDTLNISNLQLTGIITSGQKSIYIQLPLTKPIGNDVNTITLNANALFYIRHVTGGYIINNQTLTSIGTVTLKKNISGIFIGVDMTNAFTGCPNNTPLVISTGEGMNDYITFS